MCKYISFSCVCVSSCLFVKEKLSVECLFDWNFTHNIMVYYVLKHTHIVTMCWCRIDHPEMRLSHYHDSMYTGCINVCIYLNPSGSLSVIFFFACHFISYPNNAIRILLRYVPLGLSFLPNLHFSYDCQTCIFNVC